MIKLKAANMSKPFFKSFLALSIGAITIIVVSACSPTCGNEQISSLFSDTGELVAYKFNRNCGATTSYNVQIAIMPRNDGDPNGVGNVFIADGSGKNKISNPLDKVSMVWVNDQNIIIYYSQNLNVFKKESKLGEVNIKFKKM